MFEITPDGQLIMPDDFAKKVIAATKAVTREWAKKRKAEEKAKAKAKANKSPDA